MLYTISETLRKSLKVKYLVETEIFLAHVVPMSNWLFLHWSVYCMFVDKSCTESYPSCVDALQKFRIYYLTESQQNGLYKLTLVYVTITCFIFHALCSAPLNLKNVQQAHQQVTNTQLKFHYHYLHVLTCTIYSCLTIVC